MQQMICDRCGKEMPGKGSLGTHKRWCGTELRANAFWSKVDKSAGEAGCWLYTGFRKWDGYGWLSVDRRYMTAHRYAWILKHGSEPAKGVSIRHKCDNPPCCNPDHLEVGTHAENMRDAYKRRRHAFGERSWSAKLTLNQVRQLRKERDETGCTFDVLARRYGVSNSAAQAAYHGRSWKIDEQAAGPKGVRTIRPVRKEIV